MKEPDSPCYGCEFEHEDKKNTRCENCDKRLRYAVSENMIPASALEPEVDPIVIEARKAIAIKKSKDLECDEDKCHKTAQVKGKCRKCYGKAYYDAHHPKKEKVVKPALPKKEEIVVEKDKPKCDELNEQGIADCTEPVKAKHKCEKHYQKWKRDNPHLVRHYSRRAKGEKVTHFDVRLQAHVDADEEKYELLVKAADIARLKYRTINNQIFYWIKQGIEREDNK